MFGILDCLKIGAGAAVGAALMLAPAYLYGKREGRQEAALSAIENSVRVLRERDSTDEEISASDIAGLCRYFGLQDDEQRECVRRLEKADADP